MNEIQKYFLKANEIALTEILTEAERLLSVKKQYTSFTIGMGVWFFSDKDGYPINEVEPSMKKIDDLMSEWDAIFKISGGSIKIRKDFHKCYHWAGGVEEWFNDSVEDSVKKLC